MAQNGKPKLEVAPGQEARLRIMRPVVTGQNGYGRYYLYSVLDLDDDVVKSFFAPEQIHQVIDQHQLVVGSEFVLKRLDAGKGSKLEIALVGKSAVPVETDNLKQLLLQSIRDAVEIVKEAGVQFSNDEVQKLATTLFIQRARL